MGKLIEFKVKPGMVCAFDPDNLLKQKDTEISHVLVYKRYKYKPFCKSIWIVQNADDPNSDTFSCPEFLLSPVNVSVIRIPSNIPEFSDLDIDTLEHIIKNLNEYISNRSFDMKISSSNVDRLYAIYEKIKFCKEMRDV